MKKYLNRDGLEEYNSLLPHSSGEMQEYVNDWLDAHPEATTTVQDGGITTQKLADASVTRNKFAADVAHLLGGMMLTKEVQGEILTASDAYSVAPLSLEIDGKSTQDGTPTPDAPVPIDSVEVLELNLTFSSKNLFDKDSDQLGYYDSDGSFHSTTTYKWWSVSVSVGDTIRYRNSTNCRMTYWKDGVFTGFATQTSNDNHLVTESDNCNEIRGYCNNSTWNTCIVTLNNPDMTYQPYEHINVSIPMQGHVLRSLPDGTCDTMSLSYLRESDRVGWAWYARELVQRIGHISNLGAFTWTRTKGSSTYETAWKWRTVVPDLLQTAYAKTKKMCDTYVCEGGTGESNAIPNNTIAQRSNYKVLYIREDGYMYVTPTEWAEHVTDVKYDYVLEVPITTQLDPIELPILPAPNCTISSDPTTGLKMSYMRNSNIVISNIEQAIADL